MTERVKAFVSSAAGRVLETDFVRNFIRDLKSLRALWNYVYLALFCFLCVWSALYHPEHLGTAIMTTGTVVSVIFSGYIFSRSWESKYGGQPWLALPQTGPAPVPVPASPKAAQEAAKNEEGAEA